MPHDLPIQFASDNPRRDIFCSMSCYLKLPISILQKHYYRYKCGETLTSNKYCITIFSQTNEVRWWYDDPLTCTDVQWTKTTSVGEYCDHRIYKKICVFKTGTTNHTLNLYSKIKYIGIIYMFSRCTGNFVRLTT